jgi:hypothetical protein
MNWNTTDESMPEWIDIAEVLRVVRRAGDEFFTRGLVDRLIIGPMLLDRVAADLEFVGDFDGKPFIPSLQSRRRTADEG